MFEEISWWMGLGAVVIFALGGAAGYLAARQTESQRYRRMEEELSQTKLDLSTYRGLVDRHFQKTSMLFNKLTDDYREVYEHLAYGAQTLCRERPSSPPLTLPRKMILPETQIGAWPPSLTQAPQTISPAAAEGASLDRDNKITPLRTEAATAPIESTEITPPAAETTAEPTGESTAVVTGTAAEAEAIPETDAETEIEEIHLGVESATGMDYERRTDRRKSPSTLR